MKPSLRIASGALALAALVTLGCPMPQTNTQQNQNKGGSGGGGAPDVDYSTYVTEITPYPGWPQDPSGLKAGWYYEKTVTTAGPANTKNSYRWAVVAVAGDLWKVEANDKTYAYPGGLIEAVVIQKDGTVPEAYVGKKGGKIKAIKINPQQKPAEGNKPEESDEKVSVKAGEFDAHKAVYKTMVQGKEWVTTSWSGKDGDVKGVLLKSDSNGTVDELAAKPETGDWKCGDKTYKVVHLTYTSGNEWWNLADGPWPMVGALVKSVTKAAGMTTTVEVTAMGDDAKPVLDWNAKDTGK